MFGDARKHARTADAPDVEVTHDAITNPRILRSLDFRLRTIEGKVPTFFLNPTDDVILPAMQTAQKHYESKTPGKGKPHPMGARRLTYAHFFLKQIMVCDLTKADEATKKQIEKHDSIAAMVKGPSLAEQQILVVQTMPEFDEPSKLGPIVDGCTFIKCKKPDTNGKARYLFSIEFAPSAPYRHIVDLVTMILISTGATRTDGPPPAGPLIRSAPKK